MIRERDEFKAYTEMPVYRVKGKRDLSFLGRFTFSMLQEKMEGLGHILTVIARGFLFDGGDPYANIDKSRRALCAWCSMPEKRQAKREEWQFGTDFRVLHEEFPTLVTAKGAGWLYRHVHEVIRFTEANPGLISDASKKASVKLKTSFDDNWHNRVIQMQVPIFAPGTRSEWLLRFDDIIADALEAGPLQDHEVELPEQIKQRISRELPKEVPQDVAQMLYAYYIVHKPADSDWVVLPVSNFDAYFGNTNFGRKYLSKIPESFMIRSEQGYGVCRVKMVFTDDEFSYCYRF